ncbi:MAG: carboxypeptidase-like regulatory domain-containing protein, partial [Hymenobacter sp.]
MLVLRILLLNLLCVLSAAAQVTISGTVRDSLTHQPLPFASVFLANTTRGATTDAQGHYALAGVPAGRYELAATYVGYRLKQRPLVVADRNELVDVSLPPAAQQLAEVVVRPNPHRAADYQRFLELFLGTSTLAKQCRVRNPDAVQIDYDPERNV